MTLLLCAALAGCAGANAAHDVVYSSQVAAAPPAAEAAAEPEQPAPKSRGARTAKRKNDDDAKDENWWKEGGVTREKINAMCWMKFEKGHADLPIDKRADLVDQCVTQALKEHPVP
jgi:hypothetical protein